ncbi:biotin/lipoyl-binding protein [Carboxylicivirga sp. RSCT41]|uniref:biotin/lipoyl-binding protein n=1 Tax=Carboxylicivirga agarovorans TaxID=3417570 RepID=UPI003D327751
MQKLQIILTLFFIVFAIGCNTSSQTEEPEKNIRPIKVFSISDYSQYSGRIFPALTNAIREVELSFRVSGVLNKFNIQDGQLVHKGELISAIDSIYITRTNQLKKTNSSLLMVHLILFTMQKITSEGATVPDGK